MMQSPGSYLFKVLKTQRKTGGNVIRLVFATSS